MTGENIKVAEMARRVFWLVLFVVASLCTACGNGSSGSTDGQSGGVRRIDEYTIVGEKDLLRGYEPRNQDGTINVVVEIPTGSAEKWEVDKSDGSLKWEINDGKPRVVRYLGYPGNYGIVPQTVLPKEAGGDGDPLDVIVLGQSLPRGAVVKAKLIGALLLLERGEQDDKLLAVTEGTPLFTVGSLADLNQRFPGITEILELWFTNYKGPGRLESLGFAERDEAEEILDIAIAAFMK